MRAEILAVGTELLLGEITNSNAQFLSRKLAELGIDVFHHTTVGDNPTRLRQAVETALGRADLLITTGGLGPTQDDITKETVAEVFRLPLEVDQESLERIGALFERIGVPMTENNRRQALMPRGAEAIPNDRGTAPGVFLKVHDRVVVCLPGPPAELIPMFESWVEPRLAKLAAGESQAAGGVRPLFKRTLKVCGLGEALLEDRIKDILTAQSNPTIAPYAKLGEVHLRLAAKASSREEAERLFAPVERELRQRLGDYIYGTDEATLEKAVGDLLRQRNLTLAVAESCTGGLLGHRITNVPGSSEYFHLGVTAYDNRAKTALLGVPRETLDRYGAVSTETAVAMATGILALAGTDVAVAVTGIAGPGGGTEIKPVGTVYFAVAGGRHAFGPAGASRHKRSTLRGNREEIKQRAAQVALIFLRQCLLEPFREETS